MSARKIALMAMLLALALALHQVERMLPLPILPYPGVKLGIGNLVTLVSLFLLTPWQALLFVILRSLLTASLGSFSALLFSLTGALFAFLLMNGLARCWPQHFTLPGLSIAGAVAHNIGQLCVAAFFAGSFGVMLYLPVLLFAALFSGLAIGLIARLLLTALYRSRRYPLDRHLLPLLALTE